MGLSSENGSLMGVINTVTAASHLTFTQLFTVLRIFPTHSLLWSLLPNVKYSTTLSFLPKTFYREETGSEHFSYLTEFIQQVNSKATAFPITPKNLHPLPEHFEYKPCKGCD